MYFATIDCGTTNSRVHILDENYKVIRSGFRRIGVRNTAISASKAALKDGLTELIKETVQAAKLRISDLRFIITSGMITSEIGLLEIPHLQAPVGIDDLIENIKIVRDPAVFPLDIPLIFVRGVKNYVSANTTYKEIRKLDFMRGEETQAAGMISLYPELSYPLTLVVLSSHTKFIYINQAGQIGGSLTTLSGQIYEAVIKETSIGKSITGNNGGRNKDYFNPEIVDVAYDAVQNAGFLRTLLMARFMEVLLETKWDERNLFINAAICAEDIKVLNEYEIMNFTLTGNFVLVGPKNRCMILKHLLAEKYKISGKVLCIDEKEEIDKLSIAGAVLIAKKAGLLKKIR